MIFKNQQGVSLPGVLIAAALLGGLSMVMMQIMKNMNQGQMFAQSFADELQLEHEIGMILNTPEFCRVSLAGNGPPGSPSNPQTFQKSLVTDIEDDPGHDIELYSADETGFNRSNLKFSPIDDDAKIFGAVEIKTMKLFFPNGPDVDFSDGLQRSLAELRVVIEKRISPGKTREKNMRFPVMVETSSSGGTSTILSCETSSDRFTYPVGCEMEFTYRNTSAGGTATTADLDMGRPGFVGVRAAGGDIENGDQLYLRMKNCPPTDPIGNYLKVCRMWLGERDEVDNNSTNAGLNSPPAIPSGYTYSGLLNGGVTLTIRHQMQNKNLIYYRLECPNGANSELNAYMKDKCMVCMGQSDTYGTTPRNSSCKKIQDWGDPSWGNFGIQGKGDLNDVLFFGFFCKGEYAPIIQTLDWEDS